MKKIITIIISLLLFFSVPQVTHSQDKSTQNNSTKSLEAEIIEVGADFIRVKSDDGQRYTLDKNSQFKLAGQVHKGDDVILKEVIRDGQKEYIISSFDRSGSIIMLFVLFAIVLVLVNGKRGLKSLLNLIITYTIILSIIIPLILNGWSPVLVTVVGGIIAMGWNVYFSHGINKKSHATMAGIASSLLIVGVLGWLFIRYGSLSGSIEQGANILYGVGYKNINFRGLLLAAVLIGALGVLDDLVVSQVSVVKELKDKNPDISKTELFKSAMRVGHDHTSAIVNTLVLAYTSASFPLVILFSVGVKPFNSLTNTLNNETVATEIVRMLVGGIGILLSMPIATVIATYLFEEE